MTEELLSKLSNRSPQSYKKKRQKTTSLLHLIHRSKLSHPNWCRRPWRREEIEIDLPTIRKKMRNYSAKNSSPIRCRARVISYNSRLKQELKL